ncbi:MAG: hypothetical protein IJX85_04815 [Lachnospiraceae bacterium]|nr:hypothetical protein [Lachnospiraceae bacterium]
MSNKTVLTLKNYPAILLLFVSIISLGLFTDGSEFGHIFESIMRIYSIAVSLVVPVVCILISIYVKIKVKLNGSTPGEILKQCVEIKLAHKDVYVAFVILGTICTITVFPIMVTFMIIFVVWSMQFQTGYIGKMGMQAMYESGTVDEQTYKKYLNSRYIIFRDIKVIQDIVKDKNI